MPNQLAMTIEDAALEALFNTGALKSCLIHSDVTIRVHDPDAEKHAYALATTILKAQDMMFIREDVMGAIKNALEMAADDECPACAHNRDS